MVTTTPLNPYYNVARKIQSSFFSLSIDPMNSQVRVQRVKVFWLRLKQ